MQVSENALDPSCGDGQFLGEIVIRKVEGGQTLEQALSTTYGVELMQDNVDLCRERLLCGHEEYRHIVEKNIVCADALTYDYSFGEANTFGNNNEFEIYEDDVKPKEDIIDYGRQFLLDIIK